LGIRLVSLPDFVHPSGARAAYYYAYYSAYDHTAANNGRAHACPEGQSGRTV